jgi:hypothetical protein
VQCSAVQCMARVGSAVHGEGGQCATAGTLLWLMTVTGGQWPVPGRPGSFLPGGGLLCCPGIPGKMTSSKSRFPRPRLVRGHIQLKVQGGRPGRHRLTENRFIGWDFTALHYTAGKSPERYSISKFGEYTLKFKIPPLFQSPCKPNQAGSL